MSKLMDLMDIHLGLRSKVDSNITIETMYHKTPEIKVDIHNIIDHTMHDLVHLKQAHHMHLTYDWGHVYVKNLGHMYVIIEIPLVADTTVNIQHGPFQSDNSYNTCHVISCDEFIAVFSNIEKEIKIKSLCSQM